MNKLMIATLIGLFEVFGCCDRQQIYEIYRNQQETYRKIEDNLDLNVEGIVFYERKDDGYYDLFLDNHNVPGYGASICRLRFYDKDFQTSKLEKKIEKGAVVNVNAKRILGPENYLRVEEINFVKRGPSDKESIDLGLTEK